MKTITTNTSGEIKENEYEEPTDTFVTGLSYDEDNLDTSETIESVAEMLKSQIDENGQVTAHLNRRQRRALMKKGGKKGKEQLSVINETAKKLDYIDLIQKLRKLNEEKEKEENETT